MAYIDWEIRGPEIAGLQLGLGLSLPVQRAADPWQLPGHGRDADRARPFRRRPPRRPGLGRLFAWPGPIHEGKGEAQPVLHERADARQREAILKILAGEETSPAPRSSCLRGRDRHRPRAPGEGDRVRGRHRGARRPVRRPGPDRDDRRADPQPGHRPARTGRGSCLPHGFEYSEAEFGSTTTKATGKVPLDWTAATAISRCCT